MYVMVPVGNLLVSFFGIMSLKNSPIGTFSVVGTLDGDWFVPDM